MNTCNVVLSFQSVDKTLSCDRSIETLLAALLSILQNLNLGFFLNFNFLLSLMIDITLLY